MDRVTKLRRIVGKDNVLTDPVDCLGYSRDMSLHVGRPDVVVYAVTTDQVSKILALANKEGVPVTARGGGTSVTGAVLPRRGGILLNLARMNKIKEINKSDGYAVVEPGVICNTLNAALAPSHFFPPDPGSAPIATLGGMVATNASGVRAVKYGTTKDYVRALEVVLADGRVIRTGTKAPKSSAGYGLTGLFAASEGTLGVITEITFKVLPLPEYSAYAKLSFPGTLEAGAAVEEALKRGIPISTCEILDGVSIDVVKKAMNLEVPENVRCLLFMEIDGSRLAVEQQIKQIDAICREKGALATEWSDDPAKRAAIWSARQGLVPALSRVKPGYRQVPIVEDFGVPMSRIPETIQDIQAVGRKYGLDIATFGHVGDGNLHAVVLIDVRKGEEWETLRKIAQDFIDLTLKYEGTLTAEHGVGMAKSAYIGEELGQSLGVMEQIKRALDPNNILNPGKMGFSDAPQDIYAENCYQPLVGGSPNSFGEAVDNEILACIQCGFCTLGCPTYATDQLETKNARGRIALAQNLLSGSVDPTAEMARRLYQCTLCLNCKSTCPAQVNVSDIITAARRRIYQSGLNPKAFLKAYKSIEQHGNPFLEPREKRTDIHPTPPFLVPGAEVLYWSGCVSSYQDLRIIPATLKVLDAAGIKYSQLGQDEGCCGYFAYITGAMDKFKEIRRLNLEAFKKAGVKTVLATCSGCHKTFHDLYPRYGGNGFKTQHAVEFFHDLLSQGRLKFSDQAKPLKVIYHDPCDIGRHMGLYEPPREVIKALPGVELLEFPLNRALAKCCGGGGGMKGFDLDLSMELAEKRVLQAVEAGAEAIVSACPSCKQNFSQGVARLKKAGQIPRKLKVLDLTELVAQRLA